MSTTGNSLERDPLHDQTLLREIDRLSRGPEFSRALEMAREATGQGLEHPLLLNLIAYGLQTQGRFDEAIAFWDRALKLDPSNGSLLTAMGSCLAVASRHGEAAQAYARALVVDPRNTAARAGMGHACLNAGDHDRAKAALAKVLEANPLDVDALAGLGTIAIREGDADLAAEFAGRAAAVEPHYSRVRILGAEIALHRRRYEDAESLARATTATSVAPDADRSIAHIRLGDALHGQARYAEAFAAYTEGKRLAAAYYASLFRAEGMESAAERAERLRRDFTRVDPGRWRTPVPGGDRADIRGHAFLLGFARSGTTLLETVLSSHPDVVALEERPTLSDGESAFLETSDGLERLASLGEREADDYRAAYWRRVAEDVPEVKGKFVLDKYPMSTASLPLIWKLFPNAKILFAIRDPRDVVLSCFRRAFGMNKSMYEFTSIDGAARYYCAVMRLAEAYFGVLPLDVRRTWHEKLVTDFRAEMQSICDHLGLPWRDELQDFASKASQKVIRTPSANQVRKGLNTDGFGQWRAYEAEMAEVAALLDPWVKAFGYEG